MKISVLLAGRDEKETGIVKRHLERKKIPYKFREIEDVFNLGFFVPELPACYVGEYQTFGVQETLDKIENFYKESVDSNSQLYS